MNLMTRLLSAAPLAAALVAGTAVLAQHDHGRHPPQADARAGDPYPFSACPISGKPLGTMGDPYVKIYDGREVRLCCKGCLSRFEKDLEQSFAAIDAKIVADQRPLYPLQQSIVTGKDLPEHPVEFVYGNRLIRLASAEERVAFDRRPAELLADLDEAVIAAQRGNYPLDACPVSGEKFSSDPGRRIDLVIAGRLVRIGCRDCTDEVEREPARFVAIVDAAVQGMRRGPAGRHQGVELHDMRTIELRSGEVLIGRMKDVTDSTIELLVSFPTSETRSIARADLEPRSLYGVLSARTDHEDARAHLQLAATCRGLGLFGHAIAEAREAARIDPSLDATARKLVDEMREAIAADLVQEAEAALEDGRSGSARLAAQTVLRDYAHTGATKAATAVLQDLAKRGGQQQRQATVAEITKALASARKELDRAAAATHPAHGTVSDQHELRREIAGLERAWKTVGNLAAPADAALHDRLSTTQAELRARLVESYLALGTLYLQRYALPNADEWCNKACELDPENMHLHRLHELILQAKIVSGWHY